MFCLITSAFRRIHVTVNSGLQGLKSIPMLMLEGSNWVIASCGVARCLCQVVVESLSFWSAIMRLYWPDPHGEGSGQQLCAFFASGKVKKTWSKHVFMFSGRRQPLQLIRQLLVKTTLMQWGKEHQLVVVSCLQFLCSNSMKQRGCHDNRGMQGMLDQFSHQSGSDLAAANSLPQILTELVDFPSFSDCYKSSSIWLVRITGGFMSFHGSSQGKHTMKAPTLRFLRKKRGWS